MLGSVGLNLFVPQFPHQWSGWGEPSPSDSSLGSVPWQAPVLGMAQGVGLGRTHWASGAAEHRGQRMERWVCQ